RRRTCAIAQKWHSKSAYSTTSGASAGPRTWSSSASGGSGALPRSVTSSGARLDGGEAVEDQVGPGQVAGGGCLIAPLHDAAGLDWAHLRRPSSLTSER